MDIEETTSKYCARLREKTDLLGHFAQVTARLKKAIESKEIQRITLRVQERRRVIDRIERIDKEIGKFTKENGFSMEKLPGKAKNLVRSYLDQIKTFLERLVNADKECLALAQAEHDSMSSGILKLRQGFQLARGYGRTGVKNPRFLDLKR